MFDVAWPWAFVLLPLPFLVWWLLPVAKQQFGAALKIPFLKSLKDISGQSKKSALQQGIIWPLLIWLLLLIALAGPQWVGAPVQIQNEGRSIMLAVDLSGSMQTPDMTLYGRPVSRLQLVK